MKKETEVLALSARVRAVELVVADGPSLALMKEYLTENKTIQGEIMAFFKPIKQKTDEAHRQACADEARFLLPLREGEKVAKTKIAGYIDAERRKQEIAAEIKRKAQEEANRLVDETLAKAAVAKTPEEADRLIDEAAAKEIEIIQTAPPPPARPSTDGIGIREEWHYEITDEEAIPKEWWMLNLAAIAEHGRKNKEKASIPGVRFWKETAISGMRRG
jgi:hypothetical protein